MARALFMRGPQRKVTNGYSNALVRTTTTNSRRSCAARTVVAESAFRTCGCGNTVGCNTRGNTGLPSRCPSTMQGSSTTAASLIALSGIVENRRLTGIVSRASEHNQRTSRSLRRDNGPCSFRALSEPPTVVPPRAAGRRGLVPVQTGESGHPEDKVAGPCGKARLPITRSRCDRRARISVPQRAWVVVLVGLFSGAEL
jgi:hypothetical protein